MRAIITRGLYTFWSPKTFFQGAFFLKILTLCMVSIQEQFLIKGGLWWRAYDMYFPLRSTHVRTSEITPHALALFSTILFHELPLFFIIFPSFYKLGPAWFPPDPLYVYKQNDFKLNIFYWVHTKTLFFC